MTKEEVGLNRHPPDNDDGDVCQTIIIILAVLVFILGFCGPIILIKF